MFSWTNNKNYSKIELIAKWRGIKEFLETYETTIREWEGGGKICLIRSDHFQEEAWKDFISWFDHNSYDPESFPKRFFSSLRVTDFMKTIELQIHTLTPTDDLSDKLLEWREKGVDIGFIQDAFLLSLLIWHHHLLFLMIAENAADKRYDIKKKQYIYKRLVRKNKFPDRIQRVSTEIEELKKQVLDFSPFFNPVHRPPQLWLYLFLMYIVQATKINKAQDVLPWNQIEVFFHQLFKKTRLVKKKRSFYVYPVRKMYRDFITKSMREKLIPPAGVSLLDLEVSEYVLRLLYNTQYHGLI